MTGAAGMARRLRSAGLGALLDQARSLLEHSRLPLADLSTDPGLLRGRIHLDLTPDQAKALADFWGHRRTMRKMKNGRIYLRLAELNARCAAFGSDLFAVLAADGGPLLTAADRDTTRREAFAESVRRLEGLFDGRVRSWVEGLSGDTPSGQWFRRAWPRDRAAAEAAVAAVGRALGQLPETDTHLALFAAAVTGDPHAFDPKNPAGQLLLAAAGEWFGDAPGREDLPPAVWRALQLSRANLAVDAVSSDVAVANLDHPGHPVLRAMAGCGGAWKIPLRVVRELGLPRVDGPSAWVLENPSVFETLAAQTSRWPPHRRPLLVCTAGFLSAAGYHLLERLAEAGYRLHYGGDFDRNGLAIALALKERFPALVFWRMGANDYRRALALETASEDLTREALVWLGRVRGELGPTARAMMETGKPAYQEQLTGRLRADLERERDEVERGP